jgi:predicted nucleic acid-binding protein
VNRIVVLDNTVLTNFALVNRADLIYLLWPGEVCTTPAVHHEYQSAVEYGLLPENCWIDLPVVELTQPESQLANDLPGQLGSGERTCLALAITRQGLLASDDLRARQIAVSFKIPITGTIGILAACVRLGFITKDIGNDLLKRMIEAGYHSPFDNLDVLLS